jgi:hypothetical protein
MREANERRGDDHGVRSQTSVRSRNGSRHSMSSPFSSGPRAVMIRGIRSPKLLDWFVVNVVKPSRHAEQLRLAWKDGDDVMGRAAWSLHRESRQTRCGLDLDAILDQIEKETKQASATNSGCCRW